MKQYPELITLLQVPLTQVSVVQEMPSEHEIDDQDDWLIELLQIWHLCKSAHKIYKTVS